MIYVIYREIMESTQKYYDAKNFEIYISSSFFFFSLYYFLSRLTNMMKLALSNQLYVFLISQHTSTKNVDVCFSKINKKSNFI
jgi:hypothetical protein